ncbi:hypothetical protein [Collimonas arenae]|uniref:hypothetical protein n=1 Tax=Collimonas arenae TaxID=279058 RepID=UPI0007786919|nr:hypothetical protein [Collimonas arenae]
MNAIVAALTFWQMGFTSSEDVIAWADTEILKSGIPAQEMIDLSLDGPATCLKQAEYVFPPRPIRLSYQEEFRLRALFVDLNSEEDTLQFVDWASRHCIGLDLSTELVILGYQFDDLIFDCNDRAGAIALAREKLPALESEPVTISSSLLGLVPNLKLNRTKQRS